MTADITAGGGAETVTPGSTYHHHVATLSTLTRARTDTAGSSYHSHISTPVTLTRVRVLAPASSYHSHISTSISILALPALVCWGHVTGVTEDETRTFSGNWTGTGTISGTGDAEIITLTPGQIEESETWNAGVRSVEVLINSYGSLGVHTPTVWYKTGATAVACDGETYVLYTAPFDSLGWVKIKVENA